ncbi:hypothetical protein MRY82_10470 [bacterium]|nr:hypothetical protein [bacterium]
MKKIVLILILISFSVFAQNTSTLNLENPKYTSTTMMYSSSAITNILQALNNFYGTYQAQSDCNEILFRTFVFSSPYVGQTNIGTRIVGIDLTKNNSTNLDETILGSVEYDATLVETYNPPLRDGRTGATTTGKYKVTGSFNQADLILTRVINEFGDEIKEEYQYFTDSDTLKVTYSSRTAPTISCVFEKQ